MEQKALDIRTLKALLMREDLESYQQIRDDLVRGTTLVTARRGEMLFRFGDASDGCYMVVDGRIKLTRPQDDASCSGEYLVEILREGHVFGEISVLDKGPRDVTATALTPAKLRFAPTALCDRILNAYPVTARVALTLVAARVRTGHQSMADLALQDVTGRVAAVLTHMANSLGESSREGINVRHEATQSDLACMVGASRETVNKIITEFESRGWIAMSRHRFTIYRPAKLLARAGLAPSKTVGPLVGV